MPEPDKPSGAATRATDDLRSFAYKSQPFPFLGEILRVPNMWFGLQPLDDLDDWYWAGWIMFFVQVFFCLAFLYFALGRLRRPIHWYFRRLPWVSLPASGGMLTLLPDVLFCPFVQQGEGTRDNVVHRQGKQDYIYAFESLAEAIVFASTARQALSKDITIEERARSGLGSRFVYFKPEQRDFCLIRL